MGLEIKGEGGGKGEGLLWDAGLGQLQTGGMGWHPGGLGGGGWVGRQRGVAQMDHTFDQGVPVRLCEPAKQPKTQGVPRRAGRKGGGGRIRTRGQPGFACNTTGKTAQD